MQPLIKAWTWPNTYITMHFSLVSWGDSQGTRSSCTLELHIFSTNFISLMSLNCCELKLKRCFFLMSGMVVPIAKTHKPRWILERSGGRVLNQQNFGKGSSFSWWGKVEEVCSIKNILVKVLHLVNGKIPQWPLVWISMDRAKEAINFLYE